MPSQGIYFISADAENSSNDLIGSRAASLKIDDRGRITLPSMIRRLYAARAFMFFALLEERAIVMRNSPSGYPLDSRGRLFLPADIRRTLGFFRGDIVKIKFSDSNGLIKEKTK